MICLGYNVRTRLSCNNEYFLPGERPVKQFFKNVMLRVKTPVMICTHCGWHSVGVDQVNELRKRTKVEYKEWLKKKQRKADMVDH